MNSYPIKKEKVNFCLQNIIQTLTTNQSIVIGGGDSVSRMYHIHHTWLSLAASAGNGVGMQQTDHSVQSSGQLFLTPGLI